MTPAPCASRNCPERGGCARAADTAYALLYVVDLKGKCVNFVPKNSGDEDIPECLR